MNLVTHAVVAGQKPIGSLNCGDRLGQPVAFVFGLCFVQSLADSRFELRQAGSTFTSDLLGHGRPMQRQPILPVIPATAASRLSASTITVARARLFRRANLRTGTRADGGHACTGSSSR